MTDLLTPIQAALNLAQTPLSLSESGALPSAFAVTDLAAASIGAAGQWHAFAMGSAGRRIGVAPAAVVTSRTPSGASPLPHFQGIHSSKCGRGLAPDESRTG
ncbi:hypothetical protein QF045_004919 [Pseudomonas sp. W4I3]|nr:hypothetical protein [Pseudomonas sp. W4I3]